MPSVLSYSCTNCCRKFCPLPYETKSFLCILLSCLFACIFGFFLFVLKAISTSRGEERDRNDNSPKTVQVTPSISYNPLRPGPKPKSSEFIECTWKRSR